MQFYANLRNGKEENHIISQMNGVDLSFDGKIINNLFGCTPKDSPPVSRVFSFGTWATSEHQFDLDQLKMSFKVPFSTADQAKSSSLGLVHCILFAITCNFFCTHIWSYI